MTKPKSLPRRFKIGRPPIMTLDVYVRFEATRRLAGESVNAHCETYSITLVGGHMPEESWTTVTKQTLRRHVQLFKREHLAHPSMSVREKKLVNDQMDKLVEREMERLQPPMLQRNE